MQLSEIAQNIQTRRNRIFLLMEELRRLRIQQRLKVGVEQGNRSMVSGRAGAVMQHYSCRNPEAHYVCRLTGARRQGLVLEAQHGFHTCHAAELRASWLLHSAKQRITGIRTRLPCLMWGQRTSRQRVLAAAVAQQNSLPAVHHALALPSSHAVPQRTT